MTPNSFSIRLIIVSLLLVVYGYTSAQAFFVPKVGLSLPLTPPTIDLFRVENKKGLTIGTELRSSRTPVYFNPGLMLYYHPIDLRKLNGPEDKQGTIYRRTEVIWIKTRIGMGANLITPSDNYNVHVRGGLAPAFALKRPDWAGIPVLETNYRWGYMEFHLGIGLDAGQWVIDFDYQMSLVRNIHTADVVENNFALQLGFMLK